MTEIAGGYRALAQSGPHAGVPARAPAPASTPPAPFPDLLARPSAPPMLAAAPGRAASTPGDDASEDLQPTPQPQQDPQPGDQPDPTPGTWQFPLVPIELPTPDHLIGEGTTVLRDWHPRDPGLRVTGTYDDARPTPTSEDAPGAEPPTVPTANTGDATEAEKADARGGFATAAMLAGIGGGFVMNAIDVARLVKKYPEALRAGQFEAGLGKLGRLPTALALTAQMRVDSRIVDPLAPRVATAASLGRSFTRFDELAMRSSVLLGASLAAIQIGSAIPNIMDAVAKDGPWHENLLQSTSGRFGLLQLGGGVLGASLFAKALKQTAGHAGEGAIARILAAGNAPIMAKPMWGRIGIGTGLVVAANELGYLDMFNTGESRPVGQVLRDAARSTPVINDSTLRTVALAGVGGIVGYKAHRAIAAAGTGISGLPKGHWVAGAAVAGLLGTQLLGGLSFLDKPGD